MLILSAEKYVIAEFVPDPWSISKDGTINYPKYPFLNDTIINTCPSPFIGFWIHPETGDVLKKCCDTPICKFTWFDGTEYEIPQEILQGGTSIRHLGFGKSVLITSGPNIYIDIAGEVHKVDWGGMDGKITSIRSHVDGFRILDIIDGGTLPDSAYLYHINFDGSVEKLGEYPNIPVEVDLADNARTCAIEASDAFLCIGRTRDSPTPNLIVRGELGVDTEIVYDESTDPLTKIGFSYLVTGP